MLFFVSLLSAHGTAYNTARISLGPEPDEAWVVVDGWGLLHTEDRSTWEWVCEEAIGVTSTYDVLAWGSGSAIAATSSGLRYLQDGCNSQVIGGLPESAQVNLLAADGDHFLAAVSSPTDAGLYRCDLTGCVATTLSHAADDRWFVKSLLVEGDQFWATLVHEQGLASELWKGDGENWTLVHSWEDGTVEVRVMQVEGPEMLVWSQPRSSSMTPALLRSGDGGSSFETVFETGGYQDPVPGLVTVGSKIFLSSYLGRTWCSTDGGKGFTEVSEKAPLVRCGAERNGETWLCADHFADGYDVGITTDGVQWEPVGCMEQAQLSSCTESTCGSLYFTFTTYGGSSSGICGKTPADTAETSSSSPCGCGEDGAAWLFLPGLLWFRRRR